MTDLSLSLASFQLPLDGLSDQVRAFFAVCQNRVNSVKRALRKACRDLLVVDLLSAHGGNIADITYCYNSQNKRYHLFTILRYLISSKTSERWERQMNAATRVVSATQAYYIGRSDAGSGKRCPFTDAELAMQWTLGREAGRRANRMDLRPAFRKGRRSGVPVFRKGG